MPEITYYTAPAGFDGCLWPVDVACFADEWDTLDEAQQLRGIALATSTLVRLTGGRVTACPITIRPCSAATCGPSAASWMRRGGFRPGIDANGAWVNNAGCGCAWDCGHKSCEVELPAPVGRVEQVKVNGDVLDPADYRVENSRYLVWQGGGECPFPATQDVNLPDTADGTFSVTYINGYPVDRMGANATAILAMEFGKACGANPDSCALPSNVVSVVRQGVSYEITPGLFPDGYTGIDEVDAYISQWNPGNLRQDSSVWSPDTPTTRVTTSRGIF